MRRILSARPVRASLFAIVAAIAISIPFFSGPSSADARVVWCSGDPTILVNGNAVSVTVHVPMDRLDDLDYMEVIFHVPSNADVKLLLNDSLLVPAKTRFVKDQPPTRGGLFAVTDIPVEIISHNHGAPMPFAATAIAIGRGSRLWAEGNSNSPLWVKTSGFLNLHLF
ncbi:MAG: hypothetical protein AB7N24_10310 [Dehalococcoidia bacterium]